MLLVKCVFQISLLNLLTLFLSDCSTGFTHSSEHGRETAPERSQSESSLLVHVRDFAGGGCSKLKIDGRSQSPVTSSEPRAQLCLVELSSVLSCDWVYCCDDGRNVLILRLSAGSGADQRVDQQVE